MDSTCIILLFQNFNLFLILKCYFPFLILEFLKKNLSNYCLFSLPDFFHLYELYLKN
nr:MAG TPA: hypothetical protein [Bacteriophage sp.]